MLMHKDFDAWNDKKKDIHVARSNKLYNAREIWWCSLGLNIGFEHDGEGLDYQRPVLILKGLSAKTCLVIPLTSSSNKHPLRVPLGVIDGKEASAILSQMRVVDTKRFLDKVCYLDQVIFEKTRKAAKDFL